MIIKLMALFDYQRFENNEKLQKVIDNSIKHLGNTELSNIKMNKSDEKSVGKK